jgi:hypothetical protein
MSPVREAGFDQVNPVPVGVSVLTKANYRALDICRMYRSLREQACSPSPRVGSYICGVVRLDAIPCQRALARDGAGTKGAGLPGLAHV